jgi:spermidine/putrescine transport system substrate-binding protein
MPSKNSDAIDLQLAALLAANRTSRRRFIGGGAAAAAAVALGGSFLAACSSDNKSATGTTSTQAGPASGTLRISNWPLYMADGFVADFQKASGITVDYKEDFNDNEQWFAKVKEPLSRKQDIGADLAVPIASAGSTRSVRRASPTGRICARTCWIRRSIPGVSSPRRT